MTEVMLLLAGGLLGFVAGVRWSARARGFVAALWRGPAPVAVAGRRIGPEGDPVVVDPSSIPIPIPGRGGGLR